MRYAFRMLILDTIFILSMSYSAQQYVPNNTFVPDNMIIRYLPNKVNLPKYIHQIQTEILTDLENDNKRK